VKNVGEASDHDGQYGSTEHNAGSPSSGALSINWNNGNAQKITLNANIATLTLSNPRSGYRYLLRVVQDSTGGRTLTWPATVKWPAGTAPTLSGANKVDLIALYWDGTSYYASSALNY
jgi:hypothetical protein